MKKLLLSIFRLSISSLGIAWCLLLNPVQAMDDSLPDELLILTFRQLPIKALGRCAQVCKRWNRISSDDYAWEENARLYQESGGEFSEKFRYFFLSNPSWKEIVKVSYSEWEETKKKKERLEAKSKKQQEQPIESFKISIEDIIKIKKPTFEEIKKNKVSSKEREELFNLNSLNLEVLKIQPLKFNTELIFIKSCEEEKEQVKKKDNKLDD